MEAVLFVCTLIGGIAGMIQIGESIYTLYRFMQEKIQRKSEPSVGADWLTDGKSVANFYRLI